MLTNTLFFFRAKFFFLLPFSFSGKKQKKKTDIFIRKHSSCNSPDCGSIFLIEERENKEVYMNEDRLLEGDQSNISNYRVVFYAEVFIMVKNGSASCLLRSRSRLSL